MTSNHERLPSLTAIRAFEAAARLGTFTLAARELHVTQSAVSRQVQLLEVEIGAPLFVRRGRCIALTSVGVEFSEVAAQSFDELRSAASRIRKRLRSRQAVADNIVTISMLPSLAAKWFTPRLSRLLAAMPDLDLRIRASRDLVDFEREGVDCAIRYGLGDWPGVRLVPLMKETVYPVASPALVKKLGLHSLESLQNAVLLQSDNPDIWTSWFAAAAVAPQVRRHLLAHGPLFSDDVSLIEAAVDGVGVALARSRLVEREMKEQLLVRVGPRENNASYAYYIVMPAGVAPSASLAQLVDWLLSEAAA